MVAHDQQNSFDDDLLYFLKERAKELDCIYQVDELLGNQRLSWPEIFEEIVRVLPFGWQFPEFCQARIIYENQSYHTPGFFPSPLSLCSSIEVNEREVGRIEVVYTQEVPKGEEGYFLEKERKLIRTIADRIGQSIFAPENETGDAGGMKPGTPKTGEAIMSGWLS